MTATKLIWSAVANLYSKRVDLHPGQVKYISDRHPITDEPVDGIGYISEAAFEKIKAMRHNSKLIVIHSDPSKRLICHVNKVHAAFDDPTGIEGLSTLAVAALYTLKVEEHDYIQRIESNESVLNEILQIEPEGKHWGKVDIERAQHLARVVANGREARSAIDEIAAELGVM